MPSWLNALDAALASRTGTFKDDSGKDQQVTLRIANAPFAQKEYAWNPDYLDALASRFGAGVRLVDYEAATEAARKAINGWVSDQTEQRIPELLQQGVLDDLTRLVLVNAIYLKAAWQTPFTADATAPAHVHATRWLDPRRSDDAPRRRAPVRVRRGLAGSRAPLRRR